MRIEERKNDTIECLRIVGSGGQERDGFLLPCGAWWVRAGTKRERLKTCGVGVGGRGFAAVMLIVITSAEADDIAEPAFRSRLRDARLVEISQWITEYLVSLPPPFSDFQIGSSLPLRRPLSVIASWPRASSLLDRVVPLGRTVLRLSLAQYRNICPQVLRHPKLPVSSSAAFLILCLSFA